MRNSIVYQEDYSCIFEPTNQRGGLYIGNLESAQNIATLRKHCIKAVLTAARGVTIQHPKEDVPYYLHVQADDNESFELRKYFNQAANFIRDALQRTNVMVHCLAGVSRSVSLVIAYLIKHCGKSYSEAYSLLKSKRRVIQPNSGFVAQLKQYEQEQAQVGSNNEVLARRYERQELYPSCSLRRQSNSSLNNQFPPKSERQMLLTQRNPEIPDFKATTHATKNTQRVPGRILRRKSVNNTSSQAKSSENPQPKYIQQRLHASNSIKTYISKPNFSSPLLLEFPDPRLRFYQEYLKENINPPFKQRPTPQTKALK